MTQQTDRQTDRSTHGIGDNFVTIPAYALLIVSDAANRTIRYRKIRPGIIPCTKYSLVVVLAVV